MLVLGAATFAVPAFAVATIAVATVAVAIATVAVAIFPAAVRFVVSTLVRLFHMCILFTALDWHTRDVCLGEDFNLLLALAAVAHPDAWLGADNDAFLAVDKALRTGLDA